MAQVFFISNSKKLKTRNPRILSIRDWEKFPAIFPEFSSGTPEQISETATAFSSFLILCHQKPTFWIGVDKPTQRQCQASIFRRSSINLYKCTISLNSVQIGCILKGEAYPKDRLLCDYRTGLFLELHPIFQLLHPYSNFFDLIRIRHYITVTLQ